MIPEIPGISKAHILEIMLLWHNKQHEKAEKYWMLHLSSQLPVSLNDKNKRMSFLKDYYFQNFV